MRQRLPAIVAVGLFAFSLVHPASADPKQEYVELAKLLSQEFRINGTPSAETPQLATLEKLVASNEPAVKRAAALMMQGLKKAEKDRLEAEQSDEAARARAKETLAAVKRGEFKRTETILEVDINGNVREREYTVDESFLPTLFSWNTLNSNGGKWSPEMQALLLRIATDRTRAAAWEQAAPVLAERFAGPPSRKVFITIENVPAAAKPTTEDYLPGRQVFAAVRFVARNQVNRDLHNVTLAVDFCHYSTMPEPTLRHVYFIPLFPKDAVIELSRTFMPTVKSKYRLELAAVDQGGLQSLGNQLEMMNGVVQVRSTAWCDEARQPTTTHPLPERSKAVAETIVKMAEKVIAQPGAATRPTDPPRPADAKYDPPEVATQKILDRIVPPLFAFTAADSEQRRRGEQILKDFQAVRKEVVAGAGNELLAACAAGTIFIEEFINNPKTGRLAILFLGSDAEGKRIRAEAYHPDKPEERRILTGFIAEEMSQRWIYLEPVVPSKKSPQDIPQDARDFSLTHEGLRSYRFQLRDGKMFGQAAEFDLFLIGRQYSVPSFWMRREKADARTLSEAQTREQAAPQQSPREAVASIPYSTRTAPTQPGRGTDSPATPARPGLANNGGRPLTPQRPMPKKEDDQAAEGGDPFQATLDGVEFTFVGAKQTGDKMFVTVLATSKSGAKDFPQVAMAIVDSQGRRLSSRPNRTTTPMKLKEGVPVKIIWEFGGANAFGGRPAPLPDLSGDAEFASVNIGTTRGLIVFKNVRAAGKK